MGKRMGYRPEHHVSVIYRTVEAASNWNLWIEIEENWASLRPVYLVLGELLFDKNSFVVLTWWLPFHVSEDGEKEKTKSKVIHP